MVLEIDFTTEVKEVKHEEYITPVRWEKAPRKHKGQCLTKLLAQRFAVLKKYFGDVESIKEPMLFTTVLLKLNRSSSPDLA